jgi:hypothetical protein
MFAVHVSQNAFLAPDCADVHAVVTVETKPDLESGAGDSLSLGGKGQVQRALVFGILLDCSGSMGADPDLRMNSAKQAVLRVIELLSEHDYFFVIAGRDRATVVMPLAKGTKEHKNLAHRLVHQLRASDGTGMSNWLREAKFQFDCFQLKYQDSIDGIFHALLLTDGKNDVKDPLAEAVQDCVGTFQCHARGVGLDWQVSELRQIANRLLGTVEMIREPGQMADDFRCILENAQKQVFNHVRLRIWTPQGALIDFVKQVSPEMITLSPLGRIDSGKPNTVEFETGSWKMQEERDYHLFIKVKAGQPGQKMLAARVSAIRQRGSESEKLGEGQVLAIWSHDETRTTVLNPVVAHYKGQDELSHAIQDGLAARSRGDSMEATRKLGLAVQLAADDIATTRLLRRVVDILDTKTGTVRLKTSIDEADSMMLDTRSTKTRRIKGFFDEETRAATSDEADSKEPK